MSEEVKTQTPEEETEIKISQKEAAEMNQYVTESQKLIEKQASQIQDLEAQLKEAGDYCKKCDKPYSDCGCDKEASQSQAEVPVLDEDQVRRTLDKLASAGIAPKENVQGMFNSVMENPHALLGYLDKIAEASAKPVSPMGHAHLDKQASAGEEVRESDKFWDSKFHN